jgi:hypothetical protein
VSFFIFGDYVWWEVVVEVLRGVVVYAIPFVQDWR